jgi:hypothetical protein
MRLRVGDWVEVRSKEDILSTLDKTGRLGGLPFMPQMFQYCGQKFQVYKRAHKTCDWVYTVKSRRIANAIHLNLRCDGAAYGGCQSACLIFWNEAWLKPVREGVAVTPSVNRSSDTTPCTEADVLAGTRAADQQSGSEPVYVCQATQVPEFSTPVSTWDIRQYVEDVTSGNVTFGRLLRSLIYAGYNTVARRRRLGPLFRSVYDWFQSLVGGIPYPGRAGNIPRGQPTPTSSLDLKPGELVRVKSYKEILETLDVNGKNRGLRFDAEQVPYCGGTYAVRARLNKFMDERTGKMLTIKGDCIVLEGAWCQSRYSQCRIGCPRSIFTWWHEVWLERVPEGAFIATKPTAEKTGGI